MSGSKYRVEGSLRDLQELWFEKAVLCRFRTLECRGLGGFLGVGLAEFFWRFGLGI